MESTHVTILSSPGLGHLIPILELAKRILTSSNNYHVTLVVHRTGASAAQLRLLHSTSFPTRLQILEIPEIDISPFVDNDAAIHTRMSVIVRESLSHVESFIIQRGRPTVLIIDFFATDAFDMVAQDLCIKTYIFFASNATCFAFLMYLPTLDGEVEGEFTHLHEPVRVPGCHPVEIHDLPEPLLSRYSQGYDCLLYHASRFPMADGILINTCQNLEPVALKALSEDPILRGIPTPPVYAVGPLIQTTQTCISISITSWLDMQPDDSVLFVSFGSGGTLSPEQVTELAWGLELSRQRFIWVVRKPVEADKSGTFFSVGGEQNNPEDYLPDGFISKTEGVGLVIPSWAAQVEILAHRATGGFMSHCGWNSALESIVHGVPMIAWPLYAEQRMNATTLVEEIGVAVRAPCGKAMVVAQREEIARVVRLVMEDEEGKEVRSRAKEIQNGVVRALDEGGSSYVSLSQVLKEWEHHLP